MLLVLLLGLNMVIPSGVHAESIVTDHPAYARIHVLRDHINQYEATGELGNPIFKQLSNNLDQAQHQLEKGSIEQANKKMEDFLKHLNNSGMQKFLSEAAKEQLEIAAYAIIEALDPNFVETVEIVTEGASKAVIVVAPDASEEILLVADELAEYIKKSTGAELTIVTSEAEWSKDIIPIYVGISAPGEESHMTSQLNDLLEDGYVIHPTKESITIMGPKEIGTKYGVYEFLERYIGVRWLMPGKVGEDVPQFTNLEIPLQDVREEPIYLSRNMYNLQAKSGLNYPVRYDWGVRNRLRNQNNGWNHYLYVMFPPSKYLEEHPEYYPHPDGPEGDPLVPLPGSGWQPNFSNEETVQIAVDFILDYFSKNPDVPSISLAVNDNGNFCEQYPSHENYTGEKNSLGLADMSNIYYAWVNKVVEQVVEVYPDKWFGVLAYQQVYDPPSFPLHERVVPYLTKERLAWGDDVVRAEDQAVVEAWKQKASNIGFYDYIYSNPYLLPRVPNHLMADVFRYGADNNVVAFFGEHNANWGDGPKTWLYAQLLWDPYQDVEALEDEWYERAVGEEAAPYLKAYYDHWRDFWENRIHETDWFQSRKRIVYFMFNTASYLSIVTDEEIAQSRVWLETAVENASTAKQKERAEIILKEFEYYEASALSYPKDVEPVTNTEDALVLLEDSVNYQDKLDYAEKRLELIDEFADDPILFHSSTPQRHGLVWSGMNGAALWELVNYIKEYEKVEGPVRNRIEELAENGDTEGIRNYSQLLLRAVNEGPVNLNASFEEPTESGDEDVTAKHWNAIISKYGKFERKEEMPYSGEASIYLHDFYFGRINQVVDAKPGLIVTQLKYYVTADTKTVGTVWLELDMLDEDGNKLSTIKTGQQPFSASLGRWETIEIMDKVPARINGVRVTQVRMTAVINGFQEGGTMYLDDFELYQAEDSFEVPFLQSAEMENGLLDIVFNKTLDHDPVASDFEVWQLSGEEPVQITPDVAWNPVSMTATLTLPKVSLQRWAQSVQYQVNYSNVDSMTTKMVSIPALSGYTQLMTNTSFENWTGNFPDGWKFLAEAFKRNNEKSYSGTSSIVANGLSPQEIAASGSGPVQRVEGIIPGKYIGVYRFMTESQADGTLQFFIQVRDANGTLMSPSIRSGKIETKTSNGQWVTVPFEFEIQKESYPREVAGINVYVLLQDMARVSGNLIYLDDMELIRVEPEKPYLNSAEAVDSQIKVLFNKMPESDPVSADFEVWQFDEGDPILIAPEVTWDAENLIATLIVSDVTQKPWGQKVHYKVSYNGEENITTNVVEILPLESYTQVMTNTSFENWTDRYPDGWRFLAEAFTRSESVSRSGNSSIVANGLSSQEIAASGSGPRQTVEGITPGKYIGVYRFMTESQADGTLQFFMQLRDANGAIIYPTFSSEKTETKTSNGKWTTVTFEFTVNPTHSNKVVSGLNLFVVLKDLVRGNLIYLDDIELYRLNQ